MRRKTPPLEVLENLFYLGIAVVSAIIVCIIVILIVDRVVVRPYDKEILNKSWQFDQIIEEYRRVHQESERYSMPRDAYNVSCWTVDDSYTDSDGERHHRSHTQCRYDLDRWVSVSVSSTKGSYLDGLRVPEPNVKCNSVEEYGCQRYGKLFRYFYLVIEDNLRCEVPRKEWESESIGNPHRFYFTLFTNQLTC